MMQLANTCELMSAHSSEMLDVIVSVELEKAHSSEILSQHYLAVVRQQLLLLLV